MENPQGPGRPMKPLTAVIIGFFALICASGFFYLFYTFSSNSNADLFGPKPEDAMIHSQQVLVAALRSDPTFDQWFDSQKHDRSLQTACILTQKPLDIQQLQVVDGTVKSIAVSSLPGSGCYYTIFYDRRSTAAATVKCGAQTFHLEANALEGIFQEKGADFAAFGKQWSSVKLGKVQIAEGWPPKLDEGQPYEAMVQLVPNKGPVSAWAVG